MCGSCLIFIYIILCGDVNEIMASIILSLFIFAACMIRQYIKYKMIKEEEKYK